MTEVFTNNELSSPKYLVRRRLELVRKLTNLKEHFKDLNELIHVENNQWTHPYKDYQGLRFDLLLTCFDILGKTKDFIDYKSWLNKRNNPLRDDYIKSVEFANPIEYLNKLYDIYLTEYGVKNNFYNYINNVIPDSRRRELLSSIFFKKVNDENQLFDLAPTDEQKLKLLYSIRNLHTHSGLVMASEGGTIFKDRDINEEGIINPDTGKLMFGQFLIGFEKKGQHHTTYWVRRWPTLLEEIIQESISEP